MVTGSPFRSLRSIPKAANLIPARRRDDQLHVFAVLQSYVRRSNSYFLAVIRISVVFGPSVVDSLTLELDGSGAGVEVGNEGDCCTVGFKASSLTAHMVQNLEGTLLI